MVHTSVALAITALLAIAPADAQSPPASPSSLPFEAGAPLGVTVDGKFTPMSSNVKVYGAIVNGESCIHDPTRDLIIVSNRGAEQNQVPNDGFVSLLNHDGSVQ